MRQSGDAAQFAEWFPCLLEALGLSHTIKSGVVIHTVIKVLEQEDRKVILNYLESLRSAWPKNPVSKNKINKYISKCIFYTFL